MNANIIDMDVAVRIASFVHIRSAVRVLYLLITREGNVWGVGFWGSPPQGL